MKSNNIYFFTSEEAKINFGFLKKYHEQVKNIDEVVVYNTKYKIRRFLAYIFLFGFKDFFLIILINLYWKIKKGRIRHFCHINKIKYKSISNLNELKKIKKNAVGISYNFELIFRINHIKKFKKLINIHHSLLPMNGGLVPIFYSIKKKQKIGTSIHEINKKIDDGKILYQTEMAPGLSILNVDHTLFLLQYPNSSKN